MKRSERIAFIGLSVFLWLPTLMAMVMAIDLKGYHEHMTYLCSAMLLYALGLTVFKRRTFFYVASVSFVFAAVEIVHLVVDKATTSMLFVYTILISEKGEFLELVSTYWFIVPVFFGIWAAYFYLTGRFIRNEYLDETWDGTWSAGKRTILALVWCAWLAVYAVVPQTRPTFVKVTPLNICLRLWQIASLDSKIASSETALQSYDFGVTPTAADPITVVFLVGETSRYDHWQVNGYERPTSPYLCRRDSMGELFSFDSCYSVANLTTVSVPFMLSAATPTTKSDYLTQTSLVDVFHEGGYTTSWIADQSFTNKLLTHIASRCDYTKYIHDDRAHSTFVDTVLLPSLRHALSDTADHRFIVLHSLGCHYKYSARYPDEFRHYEPDHEGMHADHKTVLVNSYDNAITFTDYFIERVLRELEATNRPAVLVYVGDHGENLLDDERGMFLHGTYTGSYYEYHVPLFIWASREWREEHPEEWANLRTNRTKKFTTMNLYHTFLDLGELTEDMPVYDVQRSLLREELLSRDTLYGLDANLCPFVLPTEPEMPL